MASSVASVICWPPTPPEQQEVSWCCGVNWTLWDWKRGARLYDVSRGHTVKKTEAKGCNSCDEHWLRVGLGCLVVDNNSKNRAQLSTCVYTKEDGQNFWWHVVVAKERTTDGCCGCLRFSYTVDRMFICFLQSTYAHIYRTHTYAAQALAHAS